MAPPNLRVGVVGAGAMGTDHVARLERRTRGAEVTAIVEPDRGRSAAARAIAPEARPFSTLQDAIQQHAVDAVLVATPGAVHEGALLAALQAGLPAFCEKPLSPDVAGARRVVEAEQRLERPHIQVGFMRRFDAEHRCLRELVASRSSGELLLLHCVHRNPSAAPGFAQEMLVTDSLVHELDSVPWLAGSPLRSVEVRYPRPSSLAPPQLREPILALLELESGVLADVEMNVDIRFGYQVTAEAVFERGVARIGQPSGLQEWREGRTAIAEHTGFVSRFRDAYDRELQAWVDAARAGGIAGPSAWDGLLAALACEAGVRALQGGAPQVVARPERPTFYTEPR